MALNGNGKAAITSLGVMGPLVGLIVYGLNHYVFKGTIITDTDVTGMIDLLNALWTSATAIIGRVRATKEITGIVKAE